MAYTKNLSKDTSVLQWGLAHKHEISISLGFELGEDTVSLCRLQS
jgi:hypothetical protein